MCFNIALLKMHDVSHKYSSTFYNDSHFVGLFFLTELLPLSVNIIYFDFNYMENMQNCTVSNPTSGSIWGH